MLNKIDELCAERDKLKKSQPGPTKGKVLGDVGGDRTLSGTTTNHTADNPPWTKARAEVRHRATRERLNKPDGIGGGGNDRIP
jgi:hypothetical protein